MQVWCFPRSRKSRRERIDESAPATVLQLGAAPPQSSAAVPPAKKPILHVSSAPDNEDHDQHHNTAVPSAAEPGPSVRSAPVADDENQHNRTAVPTAILPAAAATLADPETSLATTIATLAASEPVQDASGAPATGGDAQNVIAAVASALLPSCETTPNRSDSSGDATVEPATGEAGPSVSNAPIPENDDRDGTAEPSVSHTRASENDDRDGAADPSVSDTPVSENNGLDGIAGPATGPAAAATLGTGDENLDLDDFIPVGSASQSLKRIPIDVHDAHSGNAPGQRSPAELRSRYRDVLEEIPEAHSAQSTPERRMHGAVEMTGEDVPSGSGGPGESTSTGNEAAVSALEVTGDELPSYADATEPQHSDNVVSEQEITEEDTDSLLAEGSIVEATEPQHNESVVPEQEVIEDTESLLAESNTIGDATRDPSTSPDVTTSGDAGEPGNSGAESASSAKQEAEMDV